MEIYNLLFFFIKKTNPLKGKRAKRRIDIIVMPPKKLKYFIILSISLLFIIYNFNINFNLQLFFIK